MNPLLQPGTLLAAVVVAAAVRAMEPPKAQASSMSAVCRKAPARPRPTVWAIPALSIMVMVKAPPLAATRLVSRRAPQTRPRRVLTHRRTVAVLVRARPRKVVGVAHRLVVTHRRQAMAPARLRKVVQARRATAAGPVRARPRKVAGVAHRLVVTHRRQAMAPARLRKVVQARRATAAGPVRARPRKVAGVAHRLVGTHRGKAVA